MQTCSAICDSFKSLYHQFIPFVTPAALKQENSCKPDETLRISRIFALCITGLIASFVMLQVSPWAYAATIITTAVLAYVEWQRAESAADRNAVQEYLSQAYPSHLAIERIRQSVKAAQILIAKGADLNKIDNKGEGLLDLNHKKVLRELIKGGIDVKRPLISTHSSESDQRNEAFNKELGYGAKTFFHRAVAAEKVDFLQIIFENGAVQPSDFTNDQQFNFWAHVGTREAATLLKAHGFDCTITNTKGQTPLNFVQLLTATGNPAPFQEGSLSWTEREALLKALS